MGQGENPVVQQLEEQMERIRERLERPKRSGGGSFGLIAGVALGALAGGALAFFLRSREEEPLYAPPPPPPPAPARRDDDAVLLRAAPAAPSAPAAAEEEDEPIVLKTPSAPATPPVEESAAAPAAEAPSDDVAATAEAEAAPVAEEPAAPAEAATMPEGLEELTAEEVMDAPVAEFYANAVVPTDGQCPASHPIKGNINRNGQLIFHTPDSNNYARVNAEACFVSEEDAEAAGFRKSRS
jgi:hypothetical protein